jgi:hypothetical protein
MSKKDTANQDQLLSASTPLTHSVEVAHALPMHLQAMDLARHTVIAPDTRRYVVATFDDTRLGRGYVTGVYPQQNGYLTLIRLPVLETSSKTPEAGVKRHTTVAHSIQQGKLKELNKSVV